MNKSIADETPMTVLVVDDEINILKSIKRLLHRQDYQVIVTDSATKAIELMQQQAVHVILSDMKMPIMSGAQLLENAAATHPDCYRILLTGYSDMESTIDAVNKGKIHRYLQKPWDNDEVIDTINEGLEKVRLKKENLELQKLVAKQNKQLKVINHDLEEKVKLRTKQIALAMQKIESNNNATQKVLYNLISVNPNLNGAFAKSVSLLSSRIAEKMALSKQEIKDVAFAGLLCEIGMLGLDSKIYSQSFKELNYNQQQEFLEQTKVAQLVFEPAAHLQDVSDIITCQFEFIDGSGLNKLSEGQIPVGAKILAVARDYWRYVMGRITSEEMNYRSACAQLNNFIGVRYDRNVLEILLEDEDIVSNTFSETTITTQELHAGMILKYSIFTDTHILILPEGHIFTDATIQKLSQFEKNQAKPLSLIVEEPEIEDVAEKDKLEATTS